MRKDLEKVKDKVFLGLKRYPKTRECDRVMYLYVAVHNYGLRKLLGEEAYLKFREWYLSKETPASESIRRCRQKWQEEGYFPRSKKSKKAISAEETKTKEFIRKF